MKAEFLKSFAKDLKRYSHDKIILDNAQKIIIEVESARDISQIGNLKKLKGAGSYYRIRTGDYRIGLIIENNTVVFARLLHRGEIYRYFP